MEEYYKKAIAEMVENCADISLLDLIYQLLQKSAGAAQVAQITE